jgi:hypothetical protein
VKTETNCLKGDRCRAWNIMKKFTFEGEKVLLQCSLCKWTGMVSENSLLNGTLVCSEKVIVPFQI